MSKTNFYASNKALSIRVALATRCKVSEVVLKKRASIKISDIQKKIDGMNDIKRDGDIADETADAKIADYNEQIDKVREELKEALDEKAHFEWSEWDNAFYKAYKNAKTNDELDNAIKAFFAHYDCVAESDVCNAIKAVIAGGNNASARTIVNSKATRFTTDKRGKVTVLKLFYGKCAELMIAKGTIKAEMVPDDIYAAFAPKKRNK